MMKSDKKGRQAFCLVTKGFSAGHKTMERRHSTWKKNKKSKWGARVNQWECCVCVCVAFIHAWSMYKCVRVHMTRAETPGWHTVFNYADVWAYQSQYSSFPVWRTLSHMLHTAAVYFHCLLPLCWLSRRHYCWHWGCLNTAFHLEIQMHDLKKAHDEKKVNLERRADKLPTAPSPALTTKQGTKKKKDKKEPCALMSVKVKSWAAIHQWLYVQALKPHFLESFFMLLTSVNGWMLPATVCNHSAGAFLY